MKTGSLRVSVSVGILADSDVYTEEYLRWMPNAGVRVLSGELLAVVQRKMYRCKLRFTPVRIEESNGKRTVIEEDPVELDDEFVMILAANIPWLAWDAMASPRLKVDDGLISLQIVKRRPTFMSFLTTFLQIEKAEHLRQPWCEEYLCTSLQLDPLDSGAQVAMDGIAIGSCAFDLSMHPSLLTITK